AEIEDLADGIVDAVADECAARGIDLPTLAFEPGRSIIGPAGITLYEIGTTKPVTVATDDGSAERLYVSVDGGMSDNVRPALYGAQYSARLASRTSDADPVLVRIVGMHCESGDVVVDHEFLPGDVTPGDLVAVASTGAYSAAMASNYNHVPRPAVVAVRDGRARVILRGETVDDLLARDAGLGYTEGEE
ncbi:MAG: diaminopimelate decarboxylase family protein, partial [Microbacterium gubbeenense]